jgi:hypothetical protein
MSACSLPLAAWRRSPRFSSSRAPHSLQKRARRWFFALHFGHRSDSFRLGIATNGPRVPSMIFRSRTTNSPSKVIVANP